MKFSVIVPVYNVEKYLDRCINSILSQTYTDFEVILVDDGSLDNCPKMCDEWATKDNRIKVIHKENGGLLHARLSGIKQAQGEYIISVDSDDFIDENLLKVCNINLLDNPDCLLFDYTHDVEYKNDKDVSSCVGQEYILSTEKDRLEYYLDNVINSIYGGWETWRKCIKKDLIDVSYLQSLPKINYAEDYLLSAIIMPRLSKIKKLDYIGYYYIKHEGSILLDLKRDIIVNDVNNLILFVEEYYKKNNYDVFNDNLYVIHCVLSIASLMGKFVLPIKNECVNLCVKEKFFNYKIDNLPFFKQNVEKYNKVKLFKKVKYNECRPWEYWNVIYGKILLRFLSDKNLRLLKRRYKLQKIKVFLIVVRNKCFRGIKRKFKNNKEKK